MQNVFKKKNTAQQKMDNFTESMAPFLGNVPLFTPTILECFFFVFLVSGSHDKVKGEHN